MMSYYIRTSLKNTINIALFLTTSICNICTLLTYLCYKIDVNLKLRPSVHLSDSICKFVIYPFTSSELLTTDASVSDGNILWFNGKTTKSYILSKKRLKQTFLYRLICEATGFICQPTLLLYCSLWRLCAFRCICGQTLNVCRIVN